LCHYGAAKVKFVLNGQSWCACPFLLGKAIFRLFVPLRADKMTVMAAFLPIAPVFIMG